ncbi:hypothetical protein GYMLUDRAFT_34210 [Collybiopsis luxurians FD-317 M1]|nr:hypothetical protein GYMLUDRAFT_34210 [Collybiopsis luxurians FD-317 M1]
MVFTDDNYPSPTSISQKSTLALLAKPTPSDSSKISQGILDINSHLGFLGRNLLQGLPARYTSQDASQPWLLFWSLQSLSLLKVELDEGNKKKTAQTILAMQNQIEGGFGGGPGQASHLLPTYAAICTLAIVSSPSGINRRLLYNLFLSLKEPDGSFRVSSNGEVDVRGVYCLLAAAKLTGIMTEELVKGTREWLVGCQTFEGGFASGAMDIGNGRAAPLGEAHGGYTFCALAAWVLLELEFPSPSKSQPRINLKNLRRWLVNMQGGEEELFGFRGRTNKLVDGCYSWWVGGCFELLDKLEAVERESEMIWNPGGLKEYILYAAQHQAGGLRDKPPKSPDMYHTLYCLAGLSAAQYALQSHAPITSSSSSPPQAQSALNSTSSQTNPPSPPPPSLNATDPLFNLTRTHAEAMMEYFRSGEGSKVDFR